MTNSLTPEQIAQAQSWALKVSKAKGSQYTPASKNAAAYILSASLPSPPVSGEAAVLAQRIFEALENYRLPNIMMEGGEGFYPLVDAVTHPAAKDIGDGLEALRDMSLHIADELSALSPLTNEPVGVTEEYERALREASDLATWLWKTHYKDDAPNWCLCDTAAGVITQIDNMVAGLEKKPVAAQGITISREDFEDVIGFMRPLVAKWRHDDAGKSLGELFDRLSASITGEKG